MSEPLRAVTPCDTDDTKSALLADALASDTVRQAADVYRDPNDPSWQPGAFELAAAVRAHLPVGLAADDFDGINVNAALEPAPDGGI